MSRFVFNLCRLSSQFLSRSSQIVASESRIYLSSNHTLGKTFNRFIHAEKVHWSVYNMACPGNRMRWDITPEEIATKTEQLMTKSKAIYDYVGAIKTEDITYENVLKVYFD